MENGRKFYGHMLAHEAAVGEVVFNTGMTGYQETFTDPSYAGQIITMTYPLLVIMDYFMKLNRQINHMLMGLSSASFVICRVIGRMRGLLSTFIMTHHIPCLYGVDTRAITCLIRQQGVMKGVIVPADMEENAVKELFDTPLETQLVQQVTTRTIRHQGSGRFHVAVMDYGAKN